MSARTQDGSLTRGLFDAETFSGFGPSRFRPSGEIPLGKVVRQRVQSKLKEAVREHAPKHPGVYGMLDSKCRIVYIGKAKCLRTRLLSYFRENSRHPKAGKILRHTRVLVWEETADEFAALLRELELIRHFRPRFNVLGMPGPRRYIYLCLGRSPAPYVYLTRQPTGKELASYGPLVGRGRAMEAARRINDWFKLRDCAQTVPMVFAEQQELFPLDRAAKCLRYDIGNCVGPCAGFCTRRGYGTNARSAKAFLDGDDRSALKKLTKQMVSASNALKFEQATAIRDRLLLLTWLDDRLTFLRNARKGGSYIYPLPAADGRVMWYLIHRGEVWATIREPHDEVARTRAIELIQHVFNEPAGEAVITHKTVDSVLLVHAWFRKNSDAKSTLLTSKQAIEQCSTSGLPAHFSSSKV